MAKIQKILLVEDDAVDAKTLQRALRSINFEHEVHHVENGQAGLDYLNSSGEKPSLIFLDINMPVMNGLEFLKSVKSNERFKDIPVVMLTTSQDEKDKKECFSNSAAGYFVKQLDFDKYIEIAKYIAEYWSHNELPR